MRFALLASSLLSLIPCAFAPLADAQSQTSVTQGIPEDGFPTWNERTVWVLVNRDRADPDTALASCTTGCGDAMCFTAPRPPLAYNFDLSRSARLQPQLLAENNVTLMHPSPCVLTANVGQTYPDVCDGGDPCACQTPVQCADSCSCAEDTSDTSKFTQPFDRIRRFAPGATTYAENLAAGYADPMGVESGWLLENCTCCTAVSGAGATACAGMDCSDGSTSGHRANLMSTAVNSIGVGAIQTPADDCFGGAGTFYWGQDFAYFNAAVVQKVVAGTHYPEHGTPPAQPDGGEDFTFYANWYDPQGGAPSKATVVIDGKAFPMSVDRGTDGNATYAYAGTVAAKTCNSYAFAFADSSGSNVTLPASGSYLVGDTCTSDYLAPSGGSCATGPGEPWFGALLLAAAALKPRGSRRVRGKLTKRQ